MSTAYVFDPLYLEHNDPAHPENRKRLERIIQHLRDRGLLQRLAHVSARDAAPEELAAVHEPRYIQNIRRISEGGGGAWGADTYITSSSYDAAVRAAGGLICLVDEVMSGRAGNGFALVRPPGHHAVADQAMGFCLFNNVAVATRHALKCYGLERILIVDFDLHHGNGTQDAFYEEATVLYFSTHQYPCYPGSGHWRETGRGEGQGYTVNVPLSVGVGDVGYRRVFGDVLLPVARRYRPQLILVSAGYDAHWRDPLGGMSLTVTGYADIARALCEVATECCSGRLACVLEGGYDLEALAWSVGATISILLGDSAVDDPLGGAPNAEPSIDGLVANVKRAHNLS